MSEIAGQEIDMDTKEPVVSGAAVTILVEGQPVEARRGQMLAATLIASGRFVMRRTRRSGSPRGLFCAMGICYDCVMTINGRAGIRACMTKVEDGMQVSYPVRFKAYPRKT